MSKKVITSKVINHISEVEHQNHVFNVHLYYRDQNMLLKIYHEESFFYSF
jgi:hypothetical protein